MNTKPTLALILVSVALITAACSPASSSSLILDRVQPERDYQLIPQLPDTGEQAYGNEEDLVVHPLKRFHSACVSADVQRQSLCVEQETKRLPSAVFIRGNGDAETHAYPSQQLHNACVSENSQRQEECTE